jgi:FMN phosphatase YigB (HAD superfamily)
MAYIGDEQKDIAGAKNAGMKAVLIDRNGSLPPFGEDIRIISLYELL